MVKTTTTSEGLNVNYVQIVPMTFEEKVNMYMKCSKLELAKMLAERDRIEQLVPSPSYPYTVPQQPRPLEPYYWDYPHITCESKTETFNEEDYKKYCEVMQKESE